MRDPLGTVPEDVWVLDSWFGFLVRCLVVWATYGGWEE